MVPRSHKSGYLFIVITNHCRNQFLVFSFACLSVCLCACLPVCLSACLSTANIHRDILCTGRLPFCSLEAGFYPLGSGTLDPLMESFSTSSFAFSTLNPFLKVSVYLIPRLSLLNPSPLPSHPLTTRYLSLSISISMSISMSMLMLIVVAVCCVTRLMGGATERPCPHRACVLKSPQHTGSHNNRFTEGRMCVLLNQI